MRTGKFDCVCRCVILNNEEIAMEPHKPFKITYTFGYVKPKDDWIDRLNPTELEMIAYDLLDLDIDTNPCNEARNMLEAIGIKCDGKSA
jgi:hypothetical protein